MLMNKRDVIVIILIYSIGYLNVLIYMNVLNL